MREEFKGMSFWLDSLPEPVTLRPGLTGVEEADIAIIGAGYCGLWTAYYLKQAQPSLSITVLESHFAGRGAAGRNGGWCSLNLPQFERLANSQKTRRQAKQIAPFLFDMVD